VHQVYYNFIRPQKSLFGNTPAEIANINLSLGNNRWDNLLKQSVKTKIESYEVTVSALFI